VRSRRGSLITVWLEVRVLEQSSGPLRYAIVDGMNVRDSRVHNYPPRWNAAPSQELLQDFQKIVVRDLPDLTLLAPAQITIYNKKVVDHTVTADGISGNLADVYIQIW
jgi:hypothetical protein